jgi:preprotein translocase subunit SecE
VARNRKRAKERRARRGPAGRPGLATAPENGAPDPIEHATPDVELANAQLAVGRPELSGEDDLGLAGGEPELIAEDEDEEEGDLVEDPRLDAELEVEEEEQGPQPADGSAGGRGGAPGGGAVALGGRGGGAALPEPRAMPGNRLVGFLQGSWRELQRVQWPDRRQVVQATSVVIGFVIIAGAFLGLSDLVASKLMNLILK